MRALLAVLFLTVAPAFADTLDCWVCTHPLPPPPFIQPMPTGLVTEAPLPPLPEPPEPPLTWLPLPSLLYLTPEGFVIVPGPCKSHLPDLVCI